MPIYKALLKYGHSKFTFEILEYCDSNVLIEREQYYLSNFDFEYNVLENAHSILGFKHSEEVLEKMKGRQNLLGFKHTKETLNKLKELQLNN
jgi:group I intron endonuclease